MKRGWFDSITLLHPSVNTSCWFHLSYKMTYTANRAAIAAIVLSALLSVFTLLLFKLGPQVEKATSPVFTNIKTTFIGFDSHSNSMDFIIMGIKDRSCLLVTPKVEVRVNNRWIHANAIMLRKDGSRLPIEEQRIPTGSPFIRRFRVDAIDEAIRVGTESKCHPFWLTETHLFYRELTDGAKL